MNLVTVRREGDISVADWGAGLRRCAIGWGGIANKLREGDGVTPIGTWPVRRVLYRADRLNAPATVFPVSAIEEDDGWCDAPDDRNYNRPVKLPYPASSESLWREDSLYDLVVVLGFNDAPVIAGRGSAIFLHAAASDFETTAGCVALPRSELLELLASLQPGASVRIEGE
jgi:L,D-peptidoglycan transpeptidase YkuD (ErfK/YbiS/YcfS/YnhG family)